MTLYNFILEGFVAASTRSATLRTAGTSNPAARPKSFCSAKHQLKSL